MSDSLLGGDDAATLLTSEEREGLVPSYITHRRELNEAEQQGITTAQAWAFMRKRDVLDESFLRRLHLRMFGDVWRWAGQYRTTARNIGVDAWRIGPDVRQLLADVGYWIEHDTYSTDEIAARFHHRLVSIHCFPNGNGRHARLAADLLLIRLGRPSFTWGRQNLVAASDTRRRYVEALRAADNHDLELLLAFVRS